MQNAAVLICAPPSANVTVKRPSRPREYLTEREVDKLIDAAGKTGGDIAMPLPS